MLQFRIGMHGGETEGRIMLGHPATKQRNTVVGRFNMREPSDLVPRMPPGTDTRDLLNRKNLHKMTYVVKRHRTVIADEQSDLGLVCRAQSEI
jgi:hypothetical protein